MNPTIFYADMNPYGDSVKGGTADDTTALVNLVNLVPAGTTIILNNATYSIQPDALTFNKHGVVIAGAQGGLPHQLSASLGTPKIKILADGGYGVKVGASTNYTGSGLVAGTGFHGVNLDFNGKKFTDAAIVLEGITRPVFSNNMILRSGQNTAGRYCKAMRLRVVWDGLFQNNMFHSLYNNGASIIEFDAQNTDANGNCNTLRWISNHLEQIDGKHFCALQNSNLDGCRFHYNKHEMGDSILGNATDNFVYDITSAHRTTVSQNSLNRFITSKFAALYRVGHPAGFSSFNRFTDNDYSAVTCNEMYHGASGAFTECFENRHDNASVLIGYTNASASAWRYVKPSSTLGNFPSTATNP